ncbi:MAG: hypothetical protein R6U62_09520 [Bacteroidales bacterium]
MKSVGRVNHFPLESYCNDRACPVRGFEWSPQLQAGLGRPAIYKKRVVVAAALGLRT